jgi:very-short-patch-repair endonuclease
LDGKIHDFQKDEDEFRENILKDQGLRILRIRNEELDDITAVLKKIKQHTFE